MSDDPFQRNARRQAEAMRGLFAGDLGVPQGDTFGGTPSAAGALFFRSDLGMLCYYDGTRWLSAHEFHLPLESWQSFGTGSPQASGLTVPRGQFSPYVTRVLLHTRVAAPNNSLNYWTLGIQALDTGATTSATIASADTLADASGAIVRRDVAPTVVAPNPSDWFRVFFSKSGLPGAIEYAATLTYRLIVT